MADDASTSAEQNPSRRETLRVTLPPRPLKPDSTQLGARPQGTSATMPMRTSGTLTPAGSQKMPPAWSTAVTQPMQKTIRPPTGLVSPIQPQLKQSASLSGSTSRAKTEPLVLPTPVNPRPAAPPVSGGNSRSKTALLNETFATSSAPPLTGVVPAREPSSGALPPSSDTTPSIPTKPATGRVGSGQLPSASPRVIVANPAARVFVSSGKVEKPADLAPVPHESRPPALPMTGALPNLSRQSGTIPPKVSPLSSGLNDTSRTPLAPPSAPAETKTTPVFRVPEPLAPQPPLVPSLSTTPPETPASAAPTSLVTPPPLPASRPPAIPIQPPGASSSGTVSTVTPPLVVSPASPPNFPLPVAKSSPIVAPTAKPPVVPAAEAIKSTPTIRPPSVALPRRTASVPVTGFVPPIAAAQPVVPLLASKTAAMLTPTPVPAAPVAIQPNLPLIPSPASSAAKKSSPLIPPVEPLMRKSTPLIPPPAQVTPAPVLSAPETAKKSGAMTPPIEPLLRKSARLFQPPFSGPLPVVAATPVPSIVQASPSAPVPAIPSVPSLPVAVRPMVAPPTPATPVKRSSRIILPASPEAREVAPFSKTPPALTVVPPVTSSGKLPPAASVAPEAISSEKKENSTPPPMDTPAQNTPPSSASAVPPPPIHPPAPVAPPQIKPLTARLDLAPPTAPSSAPTPSVLRPTSGAVQSPVKSSLPENKPASVAPPRRSQAIGMEALAAAGAIGAITAAEQTVSKPVFAAPASPAPAMPPPVSPLSIKPEVSTNSTLPTMPPPVSPAPLSAAKPSVPVPMPPPTPSAVQPVVPKPVLPGAVAPKPVLPGAVAPVSPIKPVLPGAIAPIKPVTPGGLVPVPLKPAAAVPVVLPAGDKRTGTTAVKNAPPKETARITVKPSLPGRATPTVVKPVVAAGAVAAATVAAAGSAPASKPVGAPPVAIMPGAFEEERSTTLTTSLAGVMAILTWGTAALLLASYLRVL